MCDLSHAGKTSYTSNIDWFDTDDTKIGSFMTKHIAADKKTRRAVALPEYFFKDIQSHFANIKPQTIERADLPIIPSKAYSFNVRALLSDCDYNNHVNQATYLKWCSDAASEGATSGHFSYFNKHIELYPLKLMKMYYNGEGLVKDELVIYVWECEKDTHGLVFAIQNQGNIIFHMELSFYDNKIDEPTKKAVSKI